MQLYVVDWSFQNNEDQLFATNEFCQYLKEGKLDESIEGFELEYIAHIPQNGSGIIICKAAEVSILFRIFNMWRKNFNITFNFKPALTNEEFASTHIENSFWARD